MLSTFFFERMQIALQKQKKTKIFVILTFRVLFIPKIFVYLEYRKLNDNKN